MNGARRAKSKFHSNLSNSSLTKIIILCYTEIRIEGISAGKGTGYSKKESQQNAAQAALKKIKNDAAFKEQIEATKAQNHQQENTEEAEEIIESA